MSEKDFVEGSFSAMGGLLAENEQLRADLATARAFIKDIRGQLAVAEDRGTILARVDCFLNPQAIAAKGLEGGTNDKLLSIIESARKAGVPADVILNSLIANLLEARHEEHTAESVAGRRRDDGGGQGH